MSADQAEAIIRRQQRYIEELESIDAVGLKARAEQARAQVDRVRALHQPQTLLGLIGGDCADETCDHEDSCPTDSTAVVCAECDRVAEAANTYYGEDGVDVSLYPCPTVRALDGEQA